MYNNYNDFQGNFYETIGFDAVVLAEYAGCNPMGIKEPQAGVPLVNIYRTLKDLTDNGYKYSCCCFYI